MVSLYTIIKVPFPVDVRPDEIFELTSALPHNQLRWKTSKSMIDKTALLHGLVALFVPLGWSMILYPFYRADHREWKKTLVFVVVLSFSAMVAKEVVLDPEISPDDIAADLLGLFFGTAIVSVAMYLERKLFSRQGPPAVETAPNGEQPPPGPEGRPAVKPKGRVSLRDTMAAWARIQERAVVFYEASAVNVGDATLRNALSELARDKRSRAREVRDLLSCWPSRTPDVVFLDWMDEEVERFDLYAAPPAQGLSADALTDRALAHERDAYHLFFGLRDCFGSQSWKAGQMDQVIRAQEHWLARVERLAAGTAGPSDSRPERDDGKAPVHER
jgi:hypothetical protein